NAQYSKEDLKERIEAWQAAIASIKRKFGAVKYSFQKQNDDWEETFQEAAKVKPKEDFIPTIKDIKVFISLYKESYEAFKKRAPIVGGNEWFRVLKNIYDNLTTGD